MLLPLLLACGGSDYALEARLAAAPLEPTSDFGDGGAFAAMEARVSPVAPTVPTTETTEAPTVVRRAEDFALGPAPTPVADFLFVLDESISMRKVMDRVNAGLRSLTRRGVFPSGSRIAVMNMTPADPTDPTRPHPATRPNGADEALPGFDGLVDRARILNYQKVAPAEFAARYRHPGCDAWFKPGDRDADGTSCLRAHTRIPFIDGRAEAGLVVLRQWLERTEGEPRFRSGAAVNVVFISDTHDPGLPPKVRAKLGDVADELVSERPDFGELEALVDEPVAAFRLHAIAPESNCGEVWDEPTYFDVVDDAGGVRADVCTTTDYAAVIDRIAKAGSIQERPVLRLGYAAAAVESVTIGGEPVPFTLSDDGHAVELAGVLPASLKKVRVTYQVE